MERQVMQGEQIQSGVQVAVAVVQTAAAIAEAAQSNVGDCGGSNQQCAKQHRPLWGRVERLAANPFPADGQH